MSPPEAPHVLFGYFIAKCKLTNFELAYVFSLSYKNKTNIYLKITNLELAAHSDSHMVVSSQEKYVSSQEKFIEDVGDVYYESEENKMWRIEMKYTLYFILALKDNNLEFPEWTELYRTKKRLETLDIYSLVANPLVQVSRSLKKKARQCVYEVIELSYILINNRGQFDTKLGEVLNPYFSVLENKLSLSSFNKCKMQEEVLLTQKEISVKTRLLQEMFGGYPTLSVYLDMCLKIKDQLNQFSKSYLDIVYTILLFRHTSANNFKEYTKTPFLNNLSHFLNSLEISPKHDNPGIFEKDGDVECIIEYLGESTEFNCTLSCYSCHEMKNDTRKFLKTVIKDNIDVVENIRCEKCKKETYHILSISEFPFILHLKDAFAGEANKKIEDIVNIGVFGEKYRLFCATKAGSLMNRYSSATTKDQQMNLWEDFYYFLVLAKEPPSVSPYKNLADDTYKLNLRTIEVGKLQRQVLKLQRASFITEHETVTNVMQNIETRIKISTDAAQQNHYMLQNLKKDITSRADQIADAVQRMSMMLHTMHSKNMLLAGKVPAFAQCNYDAKFDVAGTIHCSRCRNIEMAVHAVLQFQRSVNVVVCNIHKAELERITSILPSSSYSHSGLLTVYTFKY